MSGPTPALQHLIQYLDPITTEDVLGSTLIKARVQINGKVYQITHLEENKQLNHAQATQRLSELTDKIVLMHTRYFSPEVRKLTFDDDWNVTRFYKDATKHTHGESYSSQFRRDFDKQMQKTDNKLQDPNQQTPDRQAKLQERKQRIINTWNLFHTAQYAKPISPAFPQHPAPQPPVHSAAPHPTPPKADAQGPGHTTISQLNELPVVAVAAKTGAAVPHRHEEELQGAKNELAALQTQLAQLRQTFEAEKDALLVKAEAEKKELADQINKLQAELKAVQRTPQQFTPDRIDQQSAEQEAKFDVLKEQLATAEHKFAVTEKAYQEQIRKLESQHEADLQALREQEGKLQQIIEQQQPDEIPSFAEGEAPPDVEKEELKARLAAAEERLQEQDKLHSEEKTRLQQALLVFVREKHQFEANMDKRIEQLDAQISLLTSQNTQLKMDKTAQTTPAIDSENAKLTAQIESLREESDQLKAERTHLKQRLQESDSLQERLKNSEEALEANNRAITDSRQRIAKLEQDNRELITAVDNTAYDNLTLQKLQSQQAGKARELEIANAALEARIAQQTTELKQQQQIVEQLGSFIESNPVVQEELRRHINPQ